MLKEIGIEIDDSRRKEQGSGRDKENFVKNLLWLWVHESYQFYVRVRAVGVS